jgi:DNA mismatch endonuclease (patch repair protein)
LSGRDVPAASSSDALARMRRQRTRDTAAELAVRRQLHRMGLRYRVNRRPVAAVRRTADIVFSRSRVAVFVDGCFWHACPEHGTWPKANAAWWRDKIKMNVRRDRDTDQALGDAGWLGIRVWEHEEASAAATRIAEQVAERRTRAEA